MAVVFSFVLADHSKEVLFLPFLLFIFHVCFPHMVSGSGVALDNIDS